MGIMGSIMGHLIVKTTKATGFKLFRPFKARVKGGVNSQPIAGVK